MGRSAALGPSLGPPSASASTSWQSSVAAAELIGSSSDRARRTAGSSRPAASAAHWLGTFSKSSSLSARRPASCVGGEGERRSSTR